MKKILYTLLKRAARLYLKRTKPLIIGITWSVWKTSCRMILAQTLQQTLIDTRISTSPKNFNSEVWLCLSILEIKNRSTNPLMVLWTVVLAFIRSLSPKRYDVLVAEYGIDNKWDMDYLLSIAVPHVSVFTVLDKVHAMQMWSPDEILKEKSKLLIATKEIVFLSDPSTSYLGDVMKNISCDLLTYATHQNEAETSDIWWRNRTLLTWNDWLPQAQFTIEEWKDSVMSISTNLLWATDAWYISLWVECSHIIANRLWKDLVDLRTLDSLDYELQPWRMSIFTWKRWSVLIDSSYNAAPKSVKETIWTIIKLRNELYSSYDLIYCLGDMRELGDFSEQEHRALAAHIAQSADAIYLVWEEMKTHMLDELVKIWYNWEDASWFESSTDLWIALNEDLQKRKKRSVVLFKWSQNTIFLEEWVKQVLNDEKDIEYLPRQWRFWKWKKLMTMWFLMLSMWLLWCTNTWVWTPSESWSLWNQVCFEDKCFDVEIADELDEQQQWLMHRANMDEDRWMLFVFDDNRPHKFWMKNTLIGLDMIWIDEAWIVEYIAHDVQPCPPESDSCPSYWPSMWLPTTYVLEINQWLAKEYEIEIWSLATIQ